MSPDTIQHGQSATLSWQTSNATDVSIDGVGAVQPSGSQQVTPTDSTTYHLTAKGSGGTQDATTRLTVTPPPAAAAPPPPSPSEEDLFGQSVKDIYFEYDKSDIRADQQSAIQADVAIPQPASPKSTSRLKDTAIHAARPNTTWPSAISAHLQ